MNETFCSSHCILGSDHARSNSSVESQHSNEYDASPSAWYCQKYCNPRVERFSVGVGVSEVRSRSFAPYDVV